MGSYVVMLILVIVLQFILDIVLFVVLYSFYQKTEIQRREITVLAQETALSNKRIEKLEE